MVLFNPQDRGLFSAGRRILDASGWFLGSLGWLAVALGLSQARAGFWPLALGMLAMVFARRRFRATLLVEWICLAWCLSILPDDFRDWAWLGAICCILGRVFTHRWSQSP